MKNKKALALIISVTLIVSMTLPGTLAVSEDQAAALDGHTLAEEEPAVPTSEEEQQEQEKPEAPENQDNQENQGEQQQTPENPTEGEKTCTCDPKPAEGEPHKVGCPLYEEQTEPDETEVEIKYQIVGPENSGTLDTVRETLLLPVSGTETGAGDENRSGGDMYRLISETLTRLAAGGETLA